jgi:hypothetical protein
MILSNNKEDIMKLSVIIDFKVPDNIEEGMFEAIDIALADALYNMGGEVLNISDYIEIEED